jgi:hypothetical protein
MDTIIKDILNDLYKFDKDLMKQEIKLIQIINDLIEIRPDTQFTQEFKDELKNKILEHIRYDNNIDLSKNEKHYNNF